MYILSDRFEMNIERSTGYEGSSNVLVGYFNMILKNVQQRLSDNRERPAFLWNRASEHAYDDRKRIKALPDPRKTMPILSPDFF